MLRSYRYLRFPAAPLDVIPAQSGNPVWYAMRIGRAPPVGGGLKPPPTCAGMTNAA